MFGGDSWLKRAFYIVAYLLIGVQVAYGQQMVFMQGINQPAPDIGDRDVPQEILLTGSSELNEGLYAKSEIPPDTLIDPDGRIVAESRKTRQKQVADLKEEEGLFTELAKRKGRIHEVKLITFLCTMLGCACIVTCGILPAFILPMDCGNLMQSDAGRHSLHLLLSFAVGSLTGDVFLHLLPTIWADSQVDHITAGIWTIVGVLFCFLLEKCCTTGENSRKKMCAVLNLVANFVDNFTHGLAIGGSFLIASKLGWLTTFAIVIHELPHEISDFAILLRAEFSKWSAVRAQFITAAGGALGACVALFLHTHCLTSVASQRILPFTAGGFINIALAQILPELMKETDTKQSFFQLLLFLLGVAVMGALNHLQID